MAPVLALLLLAAPAAAQRDAGTTAVLNRAQATYVTSAGNQLSAADSTLVYVSLGSATGGLVLEPPGAITLSPGARHSFAHVLRNDYLAGDLVRLALSSPPGWLAAVHADVDGDGVHGPGDTLITADVAVPAGAQVRLLVVVTVPDAAPNGTAVIRASASSVVRAGIAASVDDTVTVIRPISGISFSKAASQASAGIGDTLAYTITALNTGAFALGDGVIADTLPAGLELVPGTITRDGMPRSDAVDGDDAEGTPRLVVARLGALAPGARAVLVFRVVVVAAPSARVENVAVLTAGGESITTPPAATSVATPDIRIGKVVVGDSVVDPGALLTWRIWYQNRSPVAAAQGAVLVDTLAAGLALESAPGATVDGQILRWDLPAVMPGDSISIIVTARLAADAPAGVVGNTAHFAAANAPATAASARHRVREVSTALRLQKAAQVMEAAVGELVTFTITIFNDGARPLERLVVHDRLPAELRLVSGSVSGADTTRIEGGGVVFVVNGPLLPGARHVIRYSATVASRPRGGTIVNTATVAAEGATIVAADTAQATIRVRQGTPVESRTILGKVWVDRNGDGRQGAGDGGVARVPVWGVNGEIVITDADGRFSFRDAQPGTHAVRVEMVSDAAAGYSLAPGQDPIVMVRADGWTTPQVNFRLVPTAPAPAGTRAGTRPLAIFDSSSGSAVADTLRVEPLRSSEERAADERQAFITGPGLQIFAPFDGYAGDASRIFVGVRGEPNRPLILYVGDSLVRHGVTRPDGVHDFIGIDVPVGTHRIRVRMENSWGQLRWDSLTVHRSDRPSSFRLPMESLTLRNDEASAPIRVRVLDKWGVPVGAQHAVTVAAAGVVVEGRDVDVYSVGEQRHTEEGGWLVLRLRGGAKTGQGSVTLRGFDGDPVTLPVRVMPHVAELMVTGAGEIGIGSTTPAFGALTARGALDAETSIIIAFDSRRNATDGARFARDYDPLAEARYPTLGDASERRVAAPSANALSVRVERGFDWFEAGDVETSGFTRANGLFTYRRAVNGAQGRIAADNVTWRGFASMTRQRLEHVQVRADGTSGPYVVGTGVRPGSERIVVEVRAADNAARVISRQVLERYTDYELDDASGVVLLRRPLSSTDAYGNPVFVVADVERAGSGTPRLIGGVRAESDVAKLLGFGWLSSPAARDSFVVGGTFVIDETAAPVPQGMTSGIASRRITGVDARLTRGRFGFDGELLHGAATDSTAIASRLGVSWGDTSGVQLKATWMHVGDGFSSAIDSRLRAGMNELGITAGTRIGRDSRLELRHGRQEFSQYGVIRQTTALRATEQVAGRTLTQELSLQQDEMQLAAIDAAPGGLPGGAPGGAPAGARNRSSSLVGRVTLDATEQAEVWLEGVRRLAGPAGAGLPDRIGTGMTYRLFENARLEASHQAVTGADGQSYTVTSTKIRTDGILGAQMWGGIDRSVTAHASHAAALGVDRRFRLTRAWSLQSSFERRFGLDDAPLADPVRALPFAQQEPDRWAGSTTLAYAGGAEGVRFNAKGEVTGGEAREGYRIDVAGDIPLGADGAVLTRHNWATNSTRPYGAQPSAAQPARLLEQRSLVGFAFRPTHSGTLNMLAKLEWNRSQNSLGGGAFTDTTDRRRLIGAADAIWTPRAGTELAARYAVRYAGWSQGATPGSGAPVAHYLGTRVERSLVNPLTHDRVGVRLDGRFLHEQASGLQRWSAAPSLLFRLTGELQLEGGYRMGELRDDDFGGASGPFASVGLRFTEESMRDAAGFWRDRF